METKEIYVEDYMYYNSENGYTVMQTMEGRQDLIVVGYVREDLTGETLSVEGETVFHPQYGMQFKMTDYHVIRPTDEASIRRYLSSGVIRGIGEKMADRLMDAFGEDVLRIMEEEPERLAEVKGISLRMAQEFGVQVEKKKMLRDAMMFLQTYGISNKMAVKIYEFYKEAMMTTIAENPYRLAADIEGVGFKTADGLARQMGFAMDSDHRICSGVSYVLTTNLQEGNTYMPREELLDRSAALLEVPREKVSELLANMVMDRQIFIREERVFDRKVYLAEQRVASLLTEHNWKNSLEDDVIDKMIRRIERDEDYQPDPLQEKAVRESVKYGVFLLTGGPGTGKTTTLNTMIRVFLSMGRKLLLAAPTGRAAKRMSEATGYEAKTIHRLLEVKASGEDGSGFFERNEDNPLEADVIIVDEMSMVDLFLFQALLRAVPEDANLILVGDPNQLPSVGAGQVLADLLQSGCFASVQLTTIFRQSEESHIVVNAHRIRKGEMIRLGNEEQDFIFLRRDRMQKIREDILSMILRILPKHFGIRSDEIQVLSPVKKGPLGTEEMNVLLQNYINPRDPGKREHEFGEKLLREGDKVMQTKNDYQLSWQIRGRGDILLEEGEGVFNGDIGTIRRISDYDRTVVVLFEDGRRVEFTFDQIASLELAYAVTIHKSQGSEYPVVLLPLFAVPPQMLRRNLLYTAVTRARECVVMLGQEQIVEAMIRDENNKQRFTGLSERLEELNNEENSFH
ncbi:MAG: ATP-dependent RecD-like DNA helicase [Lachnospiraceae bacterium]|nr:ATP-dependent RecD-like DNA helicase [Lachnospiraceae bacterium]